MTDYVVRRTETGVYLDIDGRRQQVANVNITRGVAIPTRLEIVTLAGQRAETELQHGDTLNVDVDYPRIQPAADFDFPAGQTSGERVRAILDASGFRVPMPPPRTYLTYAEVMETLAAAEQRRDLGIDPARVIDGETVRAVRKEIEGG